MHARPVVAVVDPADARRQACHQRRQREDNDGRHGEAAERRRVHHQGAQRLLEGHARCIAERLASTPYPGKLVAQSEQGATIRDL